MLTHAALFRPEESTSPMSYREGQKAAQVIKSSALTITRRPINKSRLEHSRRLAGMTGFEPAISALTGQRVKPLHYTPVVKKSITQAADFGQDISIISLIEVWFVNIPG